MKFCSSLWRRKFRECKDKGFWIFSFAFGLKLQLAEAEIFLVSLVYLFCGQSKQYKTLIKFQTKVRDCKEKMGFESLPFHLGLKNSSQLSMISFWGHLTFSLVARIAWNINSNFTLLIPQFDLQLIIGL